MEKNLDPALGADEIARFVRDGFVWVGAAFSSKVAAEARAILWVATGCDPDDSTTWTRPVSSGSIRLRFTKRQTQPPCIQHSTSLWAKVGGCRGADSEHLLLAFHLPKNLETTGGTSRSASLMRSPTSWSGGPMCTARAAPC